MWANKPPTKKKPSPITFSCSSFKDIHLLISDDNNNSNNNPPTPKSPSIFHRVKLVNSLLRWSNRPTQLTLPNTQDRVVIFYTSLRVIRSTSENCRTVRSILRSFPVKIDERDVSMDHTFISQLHQIFPLKSKPSLPKVFVAGNFIGGAEEVKTLHESGELKTLLAALPAAARGGGACDICGGFRFVLCDECSGSRKCYSEKGVGFRTCAVCNENGLVRMHKNRERVAAVVVHCNRSTISVVCLSSNGPERD